MIFKHQNVMFITLFVAFLGLLTLPALVHSRQIVFETGSIDTDVLPSLFFHTNSLGGLDVEEFNSELLYMVQVEKRYIAQYGKLLASKLVTFVPDDIFIIKATGEYMSQLQTSYSTTITYLQVFPHQLKQSARLQYFLSAEQNQLDNSNIVDQVLYSLYADNTELLQSLSTPFSSSSRFRSQQQSPARGWKSNSQWFSTDISPHLNLDRFVTNFVRESAIIENLGTSAEVIEDEPVHLTNSPYLFRGLSTFDPTSELVGMITNAGTHHIQALMTGSSQANQTMDQGTEQMQATANVEAYATLFNAKTTQLYDVVNSKHQQYVDHMLNALSSSYKQQSMDSTNMSTTAVQSTARLHTLFNKSSLDITAFVSTLTSNMFSFANISPSSLSTQSQQTRTQMVKDVGILSTLPFNIAFEFNKHPTSAATGLSSVPLSYLHAQLQSPLFTQDPSILSQAIASRVSKLYNEVYIPQHQQMQSTTSQSSSQSQTAQSIDLMWFKTQLQSQYKLYQEEFASQVKTRRSRVTGDTTQTDSLEEDIKLLDADALKFMRLDSNKLTLATLSQYVDALLFSLFEAHSSSQVQLQTQNQSQSKMKALSMQDTILLVSSFIDTQLHYLNELQTDIVTTLSTHPDVHFVDLQLPISGSNKHLRWSTQTNKDDFDSISSTTMTGFDTFGPYASNGVDGTGIVVGLSDTGVDTLSCWFIDSIPVSFQSGSSCYKEQINDHKKIKSYCAFYDDSDVSLGGHGSHVAGTIAGYQRYDTGLERQSENYDNGIAGQALLAFFDIGDYRSALSLPTDLADIFRHGYAQGGRIHSNSWGCSISRSSMPLWGCNSYDISAYQLDKYLHDNQDFTILMAAGNDGEYAYGTVGSTAIAKNAIVVGALSSARITAASSQPATKQTTAYTASPTYFDSINVVASFSSLGPSFDGRIKPDITTPGHYITSAASGTGQTCKTFSQSGTSMATPATAGTLALALQILQEGRQNTGTITQSDAIPPESISNSLLKSLLVNSGQHVSYRGVTDAGLNMPLRSQSVSQADVTNAGTTYKHFLLGQQTMLVLPLGSSYYYIKPNIDTTTLTHTFRLMVANPCPSTVTVTASNADTTSSSQTFTYQDITSLTRTFFDFTSKASSSTYLEFKVTDASTCATGEYVVGILEFAATSASSSDRYAEIDCLTTIFDYPVWGPANFNVPGWVYSCPPAPACTDAFESTTKVVGTNYYSLETPICKAALHAGTVNATQVNLTGTNASDEISSGKRQFVRTAIGNQASTSGSVFLRDSEHNGVSSDAFTIQPDDYYFATLGVGAPFQYTNGGSTLTNNLLYLSPLPRAQNSVSGFGKTFLNAVLPLHNQLPPATTALESRQVIIFTNKNTQGDADATKWGPSDGGKAFDPSTAKYSAITHNSVQSFCFMVPPTTLVNSYSYSYTDGVTTKTSASFGSGPDDLRVALSWYDFPGSNLATKILVNDLDLHLFAPNGAEYRGNDRADHLNNVERVVIDADPTTGAAKHAPGMYCAVVHGVYVPLGIQRFSLVANGRGISQCDKNPLSDGSKTMSASWTQTGTPQCTGAGSGVSTSLWATQTKINVRQGGNCFTMNAETTAETEPTDSPTRSTSASAIPSINDDFGVKSSRFRRMRLSTSSFEEGMDLDHASQTSTGSVQPTTSLAVTGYIVSSGALSGKHVAATPSTPTFTMTGQYDPNGTALSMTLSDSTQTCVFSYSRATDDDYGDQQYTYSTSLQVLEPIPDSINIALTMSLTTVLITLIFSLIF